MAAAGAVTKIGLFPSWVISQAKKALNEYVLPENALRLLYQSINGIGSLVAGTDTQIDDAVFNELIVDNEAEFESWTIAAVDWVRNGLGLDPEPGNKVMFGVPRIRGGFGHFNTLSRAMLVTELMKDPRNKGKTRREIRAQVNKVFTDEVLEYQAKSRGLPMKAIGDGTILNWLWEHKEEILAFILKLLPLFFLAEPPKMAAALPGHPAFTTILPPTSGTFGFWSDTYDGGDIHIYVGQSGVVIGHNDKAMKDGKRNFTSPCLIFDTRGQLRVQYAGPNGLCIEKMIDIKIAQLGLYRLLNEAVDSIG